MHQEDDSDFFEINSKAEDQKVPWSNPDGNKSLGYPSASLFGRPLLRKLEARVSLQERCVFIFLS